MMSTQAPPSTWENTLPFLADKVLLDFINDIEISRDHVRVQRQRQGFTQRLFDSLTGQGYQRQIAINASLSDGLTQVKSWLTALHEQDIQNTKALAVLGEKLLETRAGVMKLYGHHKALEQTVLVLSAELKSMAEQYTLQFHQFNARLSFLEAKSQAQDHIEQHLLYWQTSSKLPIHVALSWILLSLEDLFWGAFGNFYRQYHQDPQSKRFIENMRIKLMQAFQKKCYADRPFDSLQPTLSLLEPLTQEHAETREVLTYLFQNKCPQSMPFGWTIHALTTHQAPVTLPLKLPRMIKGERLFQHLFEEAMHRASVIQIGN